jgi:hypothetical protein
LQFAAENAESVSDVCESSSTIATHAFGTRRVFFGERILHQELSSAEGFVNFDVLLREVHVRFITTVRICLIGSADFSNYWRLK